MGLTVDQIESVLTAKTGQYVKAYQDATKAHIAWRQEHAKEPANDTGVKRIAAVKRVADAEKSEAKSASAAVKSAEKEKADAARAAAKAASDAVKASEREKQTAIRATAKEAAAAAKASAAAAAAEKAAAAEVIAAAEREAAARVRLAAVVDRATKRASIQPATSSRIGATVPNERTGQGTIPLALLNNGAAAEVAAEAEINHLLVDRATLQAGLIGATAEEKNIIRDQLTEMKLINDYKKAGITETEAAILAEEVLLKIQQRRAGSSGGGGSRGSSGVARFVEGAGIGRTGGSGAAIGGIVTAAAVGLTVEAINSALAYGKAIEDVSKQIGVEAEQLQVYQKIARDSGATTQQLTTAFGQFSNNLGRAKEGSQEQIKAFKALGINVKEFASAGDALPTIIQRISSIKDPAQRAAIETRLFGEEGRKLDQLLGGGVDKVNDLAAAMRATGQVLSTKELQELDETARKLADIKNQLNVDLSKTVANNAAAILTLANAFATLADRVLKAVTILAIFRSERNDPEKALHDAQAVTPEGRKYLLVDNYNKIKALDSGFASGEGITINGKSAAGDPALRGAYDQQRRKLLLERKSLLNYGKDTAPAPLPVQPGAVDTKLLSNLGAPKGPKGKSADTLAAEALASLKKFTSDMERERAEQLSLESDLTADTDKQREIALQRIDGEQKAKNAELADAAKEEIKRRKLSGQAAGEITARADALIKQNDINAGLERQKIARDKIADDLETDLRDAQVQASIRAEELNDRLALAKTAKERREIENDLLLLAADEKKKALNEKISNPKTDPGDLAGLRDQLRAVDPDTRARQQANDRTNASPFDQFRDNIHKSSQQITEDLQTIEVQGINSLNDGLANAIVNSKSLGDVFHNVANQIIADLIKIGLQALESQIFGTAGGGSGSGSGGGFLGSLVNAFGSLFGGGHAGGGQVATGKFYKVNEFGTEGYAAFDKPGKIVPLGEMSNRGGNTTIVQQSFTLDARYGITTPELLDHVNSVATTQAVRAGRASYSAAQANAPGRIKQYQTLEG